MKKIFAILMTIVLVLSFCTTAFAATTDVTINGVTNRDYEAHKLMTATNDGVNYSYVVNDTYKAVLIEALGLASTTDSKSIVEAISKITNAESMRHFADDLYNLIVKAEIPADASWSGETTTLEQAYWLVADVTDLTGQNLSNSLVMLDTVGDDSVTINAKPAGITTWKKLDDENDSLVDPSPISEDAVLLQDVADYDIGDEVPYTIDIRTPNNISEYDYYSFVMEDYVEEGLTYVEDSFKITVNGAEKTLGVKGTADVDFYYEIITETDDNGVQTAQQLYVYPAHGYTTHQLNEETPAEGDYVAKAASKENGGDFLKLFPADAAHSTINSSVVVFSYKCLLNENAKVGIEGNPNNYVLRYTNNPYGDAFGETPEDTNIVLTYKVIFNKVDSNGTKLTGADFDLYKFIAKADPEKMTAEEAEELGYWLHPGANAYGVFEKIDRKGIDTDGTVFTFNGLDNGFYKIEETQTPEGYNGIDPIEFRINANHVTTLNGAAILTSLEGITKVSGELTFTPNTGAGSLTTDIVNNSGAELPTTGGFGTAMMYVIGIGLVAFAVILLVTKKRMSAE